MSYVEDDLYFTFEMKAETKLEIERILYLLGLAAIAMIILIGRKGCDRPETPIPAPPTPQLETSNFKLETLNSKLETSNFKPETRNLLNIRDADPSILVDLKYATPDNFTGRVLYDDDDLACLQPDVAQMLAKAHHYLKSLHPGLRLLVYDATRPLSVQRAMWEHVKDTPYHRYIAHPDRLSLHNFGAAVDLTLADSTGQAVDMGTPFDFFGSAAGTGDEQGFIRQGILTRQQVQNRQLLRTVMQHAGFHSISGEWWHFNACSLSEAKQRYTMIE